MDALTALARPVFAEHTTLDSAADGVKSFQGKLVARVLQARIDSRNATLPYEFRRAHEMIWRELDNLLGDYQITARRYNTDHNDADDMATALANAWWIDELANEVGDGELQVEEAQLADDQGLGDVLGHPTNVLIVNRRYMTADELEQVTRKLELRKKGLL